MLTFLQVLSFIIASVPFLVDKDSLGDWEEGAKEALAGVSKVAGTHLKAVCTTLGGAATWLGVTIIHNMSSINSVVRQHPTDAADFLWIPGLIIGIPLGYVVLLASVHLICRFLAYAPKGVTATCAFMFSGVLQLLKS